jgi:hypothetical protein
MFDGTAVNLGSTISFCLFRFARSSIPAPTDASAIARCPRGPFLRSSRAAFPRRACSLLSPVLCFSVSSPSAVVSLPPDFLASTTPISPKICGTEPETVRTTTHSVSKLRLQNGPAETMARGVISRRKNATYVIFFLFSRFTAKRLTKFWVYFFVCFVVQYIEYDGGRMTRNGLSANHLLNFTLPEREKYAPQGKKKKAAPVRTQMEYLHAKCVPADLFPLSFFH